MLDFLIIGAQKSASTYVHKCLEEHPEVTMPNGEVTVFEDPDYQSNGPDLLKDMYKSNYASQIKKGIKRPDYLAKKECAQRIFAHSPKAKLIITLRNPLDRAISAYFHYMRMGLLTIKPLNVGMESILKGENQEPKGMDVISYGFYYEQIQNYLYYFDRNQILILFDDEIRLDPLSSMRKVYRFLEIDEFYSPKNINSKANIGVYNLKRLYCYRFISKLIYKYNEDNTRLFKRTNIISRAISKAFNSIDRFILANLFKESKPSLDSTIKNKLIETYTTDTDNLEIMLNKDLSNWKS